MVVATFTHRPRTADIDTRRTIFWIPSCSTSYSTPRKPSAFWYPKSIKTRGDCHCWRGTVLSLLLSVIFTDGCMLCLVASYLSTVPARGAMFSSRPSPLVSSKLTHSPVVNDCLEGVVDHRRLRAHFLRIHRVAVLQKILLLWHCALSPRRLVRVYPHSKQQSLRQSIALLLMRRPA